MTRDVAHVEEEVEGLRAELEALRNQAVEYETALDDLGRQHSAAAGRLELARRQANEYSARLEEREAELAETRRQEAAYETFRAAVASRDSAGLEAAVAIDAALESLETFVRLGAALPAAREGVSPAYDVRVPNEPEQLADAWQRLVDAVRSRIDERLEDEIVDAAARSIAGHDIGKLPEHLQVLARARRRRFVVDAAEKQPGRAKR